MKLILALIWFYGWALTLIWSANRLQRSTTRELIDEIKRNSRIVGVEDGAIVLSDGRRVRPGE